MKIVILDGYSLNPGDLSWNPLKHLGDLTIYDRTAESQIIERIKDADYVYTNKTPISKAAIEAAKHLKWIGVLATGYNVVDVTAASKKKIPVCNVPTYGTTTVAQYVFALLLELCHHVAAHHESVRAGQWTKNLDFCYWNHPLIELSGKTMGIVGMGRIGQQTAKIAQAFGMKVLAHSRTPKPELMSETLEFCDLKTLFRTADVISLHCPLVSETQGIINAAALAMMKENVLIINTARGPLVDEIAMQAALNKEEIGGYACDVVSKEPIEADNPLLDAKNCIITPHIAWATKEARVRLMETAIENLVSYTKGHTVNAVNANEII